VSVADEIKAKLDIVHYIQQYVPLKKAGRYYKAPCPFHPEKTPSFLANPDTQSWRCFGSCAEGGDIFNFAMKFHGWSFTEALTELGKLAGVEVRPQSPQQKEQDAYRDELRGLMQAAADFYAQKLWETSAVLDYVRQKRGLTDDTIARFGVGFAPNSWNATLDYMRTLGYSDDMVIEVGLARRHESGRVYDYFRNRLMIPIRDERGRVIGFGARALDPNDNPKYLNSPQTPLFDKSRTLYALDFARGAIRDEETAVIVEGYMDAIQAHQAGFNNVVAQMGTALTEAQLKQIAPRWAKKIILALDSDAAGQNATLRSLEVARATLQADYTGKLSVDMRVLHIPDAKDPDDLIREAPEQWASLVSAATPVADYVIEVEVGTLPENASLQEREAVARRVLPMLVASENNLYQKDNIQKLALKLRIMEKDLLTWASEQRRVAEARPPRPVQPSAEKQAVPANTTKRPQLRRERVQWEIDCLRALYQQPDLLYHVNRKFRELAGTDNALLNGPLGDFGGDDFTHGDYRALMQLLQAALEQDDVEPIEFLRANLDDVLLNVLDTEIFVDALELLRARLRHGLSVDLALHLQQRVYAVDLRVDVIRSALELRKQRLDQERNDISLLIMDAQTEDGQRMELNMRVNRSNKARGLIDAELHRQSRNVY
jgi:DNA primase